AIASATKESNDLSSASTLRKKFARQSRQVLQSIICMSVVHHDRERLSTVHTLKASRHASQLGNSVEDSLLITTARVSGGRRRENVIHIYPADKRRPDGNGAVWDYEIKPCVSRRDLDFLCPEIRLR